MRYSTSSYDAAILASTIIPLIISALVGIGINVGLGFVTKHMNEQKGYTGGFAWGFWLGVIGIIVVACKTDLRNPNNGAYPYQNQGQYYQQNQNQYANQNQYQAQVQSQYPNQPQDRNLQPPQSRVDALTQLAKLHEQGILTDEEFAAKKAEVLRNL